MFEQYFMYKQLANSNKIIIVLIYRELNKQAQRNLPQKSTVCWHEVTRSEGSGAH